MSNFVFIVLLAQCFPLSACKSHSAAKGIICCLQFTLEDFHRLNWWSSWEFFPPLPHGRCRKKIAPHICLRGYWFWNCVISTSASISLGQHEPLKQRERKQLGTEPEPDSGDQSRHNPLSIQRRALQFWLRLPTFPLKENQVMFLMVRKPLNTALWTSQCLHEISVRKTLLTTHSLRKLFFSWDLAEAHSVLGWGIHWKKKLGSVVSGMPQGWQSLLDADVALNLLRDVSLKKKIHWDCGRDKQENDNKIYVA